MSEIIVLFDGYSTMNDRDQMIANCSCTLIKGVHNIIVDTMTAWDSEKIITALDKHNITRDNINYVVSTHGHSDHIGNNNLFLNAIHIVGYSVSFKDVYYLHSFDKGEEYIINDSVKILSTPGHTLSDVSVIAKSNDAETIAVVGDLFECVEDIELPGIWLKAGSEDPVKQMKNRSKIANLADWIVPGHGPKFKVTVEIRESLRRQNGENF